MSVTELREYWLALDEAQEGDEFESIAQAQMPLWNELCVGLSWKSYVVGGGYFPSKHHGYCGVYRVIALTTAGDLNKPATLNRLCGQDTTGTLYIGHAGSLSNRLNQFRRTFESNEDSHGAARRLQGGYLKGLKFTADTLALALLFTGRSSRSVESDLIKAYMNTFGDAPPLNYRL